MSRPDLTTPQGRAAYARELKAVARPLRHAGLAFALLGLVLTLVRARLAPGMPAIVPLAAFALGLLNMLAAAALRTRYHWARMREEPPHSGPPA